MKSILNSFKQNFVTVPEPYKAQVERYLREEKVRRLVYLYVIAGLISIIIFCTIDMYRLVAGLLPTNPAYISIFIVHLSTAVILPTMALMFWQYSRRKTLSMEALSNLFCFGLVTISIYSNINTYYDQAIPNGSISTFVLILCGLNLIFPFKISERLIWTLAMFFCLIFILWLKAVPEDAAVVSISVGIASVTGTNFLGNYFYQSQVQEYINRLNINAERERAESLNTDLKQYLRIISHDFGMPLRGIKQFSARLKKSLQERYTLTPSEQEDLEIMMSSVINLEKLLSDLIDYSTIDKDNLPEQAFDFNDVMVVVRRNLQNQISQQGAHIEEQIDDTQIKAPFTLITQLVQNLVSNGIKFHRNDVAPVITVKTQWEGNTILKLSVSDNGVGIAKESFQQVFQIFQRLPHEKEIEGTGIGLAICQKIVQKLNGRIELISTIGEGSTFNVYLTFEH